MRLMSFSERKSLVRSGILFISSAIIGYNLGMKRVDAFISGLYLIGSAIDGRVIESDDVLKGFISMIY